MLNQQPIGYSLYSPFRRVDPLNGDLGEWNMIKVSDNDRFYEVAEERIEAVHDPAGHLLASVTVRSTYGGTYAIADYLAPGCTMTHEGDFLNAFGIAHTPDTNLWTPNVTIIFQEQKYYTPAVKITKSWTDPMTGDTFSYDVAVNGLDWMVGVAREAAYTNARMFDD